VASVEAKAAGMAGFGSYNESRTRMNTGQPVTDDTCKACGKKGHWAKDCRCKKKQEQAHVAQDDEPTLLLAVGTM
jgi:hypothetical protein